MIYKLQERPPVETSHLRLLRKGDGKESGDEELAEHAVCWSRGTGVAKISNI
jgi:hypothetical protein